MMMTGSQYEESLRKLDLAVYLFGERVRNVVDHPLIRPSMNAVALTYDLAHRPEYAEIMTATSHPDSSAFPASWNLFKLDDQPKRFVYCFIIWEISCHIRR